MSKHSKRGLLALACFAFSVLVSFQVYAACTSPTGTKGKIYYNAAQNVLQYCNDTSWIAMGPLRPSASGTACSSPTGDEAKIVYNSAVSVMQYCNGDNWIAMGPISPTGSGPCASPTGVAGAMIYNDANSVMQYCNGIRWVQIGRSPSAPTAPVFQSNSELTNIRQNMGSSTTYTEVIAAPSGIAIGDFLIAYVGMARVNTASSTGISGWTLLTSQTYGVRDVYIYYRVADASDVAASNYTLNTSVGSTSGYLVNFLIGRYSGVNTSSPFDINSFSDQNFTSASSYTLPSITTTGANKLVGHFVYMSPRPAPTYLSYDSGTSPAGYNIAEKSNETTYDNAILVDKTQASAGASGTATVNVTPNGDGGGAAGAVFSFALNGI